MRRPLVGMASAVAMVVAGCSTDVVPNPTSTPGLPTMPPVATSVEASGSGSNIRLTVRPWPLDASVAFLCVDEPGAEFTVDQPVPDPARHCAPLQVETSGDVLTASLTGDALRSVRAGGLKLGRPAYLAVAGSRGDWSAATVLTVDFLVPGTS